MFFVYVDFTDDGRPFYVGKGDANRVKCKKRNRHHQNVAAKHGHCREIVLQTHDEFEALNREIRLIAELHTYVNDSHWNGIGTNYTVGGDGAAGRFVTAQARANMSAAQRKMSAETKAKMSASKKNMSVETRQKISDAGKRRRHTLETRLKMSATRTGKKLGPLSSEARQNMSRAHLGKSTRKGHHHSHEAKAKMAASHLNKKASNETRAKMSVSQRAAMTLQRRDRLKNAALAQWARKRLESQVSQNDEQQTITEESE